MDKKMEAADEKELHDLLDDALEDFHKINKNEEEEKKLEDMWTKDFTEETVRDFEKKMENLFLNHDNEESELSDCFGTLRNNIFTMMREETDATGNVEGIYNTVVEKALTALSEASENLSNDEDFLEKLGDTSLEEKVDASLGIMQGMLQGLMSKAMLYPSLKELASDKYPKWLEEKKDSLPAAELERYKKQLSMVQRICSEYEKEKDDDSDEVKKQRFHSIVSLMQEAHGYGMIPEELAEVKVPSEFDASQNCSIM